MEPALRIEVPDHVGVRVDEAGEESGVAEVVGGRPGGVRLDLADAASRDGDTRVRDDTAAAVEHARGAEGEGSVGGGCGLRRGEEQGDGKA